jgi:transposase
MAQTQIERVDNLPILLVWLRRMQVQSIIDGIWTPHGNWQGLTLGQLAVLFIAYVIQRRTHNLSKMEEWLKQHRRVIEQVTGWSIGEREATDDRLGILLEEIGQDEAAGYAMQRQLSQQQIQAFALPSQVAGYDTSSFSVHHAPPKPGAEDHQLLRFGHSKDHRADLLQFKQGLGTLDPAGVPIFTQTLSGETADDRLYLTAWKEMAATLGHPDFLFVADCKAASQESRAGIDQQGGRYLFPLPMTGGTPAWLQAQVSQQQASPIHLAQVLERNGQPKHYGQGFVVVRECTQALADGQLHSWQEQCFVTQSIAHAQRQRQALAQRLLRSEQALQRLRPQAQENPEAFKQRAHHLLQQQQTADFFTLAVKETHSERKRYLRRGRPTATTPYAMVSTTTLSLTYQRQSQAIETAEQMAGWRVYVSNSSAQQLGLTDAILYYREEWQVEHGIHRFKKGSLPALPLTVRLPARIRGLMLLLFVALQALTLIEFVARRALAQQNQSISGLVPGNPKRRTTRPSAERLLATFAPLHLVVESDETSVRSYLSESLSPLQLQILALLDLSPTIYDFGKALVPI